MILRFTTFKIAEDFLRFDKRLVAQISNWFSCKHLSVTLRDRLTNKQLCVKLAYKLKELLQPGVPGDSELLELPE